jgi:hypothetical protein
MSLSVEKVSKASTAAFGQMSAASAISSNLDTSSIYGLIEPYIGVEGFDTFSTLEAKNGRSVEVSRNGGSFNSSRAAQ